MKRISEYLVFKDNGLFGAIKNILNVNWFDDNLAKYLNTYYFRIHSARKWAIDYMSEAYYLVDDDGTKLVMNDGNIVSDRDTQEIWLSDTANLIVMQYGDKWKADYDLITKQLDLVDYDKETKINTPNAKTTYINKSHIRGTENSNNVETNVYGFNSTNPVPVSKTTNGDKQQDTFTTGTDEENTSTTEESGTRKYETTHSGGAVTQRFQEYINFRKKTIVDIIIKDVDDMITIPLY